MIDNAQEIALGDKIDPTQFDLTTGAILVGIGAGKYIDIFRDRNIGQSTLVELCEEDLIKLGVDDQHIRTKLLAEIKNLPIYEECVTSTIDSHLGPLEVIQILQETATHLHLIHLSTLANKLSLKKKDIPDCLLYRDKYTSDVALSTIREIKTILNSMEKAIALHFKEYNERKYNYKKIFVGSAGAVAIGTLAVLFYKSVKELM